MIIGHQYNHFSTKTTHCMWLLPFLISGYWSAYVLWSLLLLALPEITIHQPCLRRCMKQSKKK